MYIYIYGMSHHFHSVRVMSVRREPRSARKKEAGRFLVQCVCRECRDDREKQ